jgi:hypothetical protein
VLRLILFIYLDSNYIVYGAVSKLQPYNLQIYTSLISTEDKNNVHYITMIRGFDVDS